MNDIISKFNSCGNKFAYKTVEEAEGLKGKVNDILLEEVKNNLDKLESVEYNIPFSFYYSLFLLAEFKDKRLFDILINYFSKHDFDFFNYVGDGVMEYLPNIIVSVFDGDFNKLNNIIYDKDIDSYARERFLCCYVYFYKNNMISKDEIIKYLRNLIKIYGDEFDDIFTDIMSIVMDLHLFEMIDDIKELFNKSLIDENMYGGYDSFIDYLFDYDYVNYRIHTIKSVKDELSWWALFDGSNRKEINYGNLEDGIKDLVKNDINNNLINPYKDIGRNDPCPCGSGKKYKKCCLDKDKDSLNDILPYQNYITMSLARYPKRKKNNDMVDLYDFYKDEYIELDKLLYKVLKHRRIPMWIKRDYKREDIIDLKTLDEAFILIKDIIKDNKINSSMDFDKNVGIHYGLYEFVYKYCELLINNIKIDNNIDKFNNLINYLSNDLEIDNRLKDLIDNMKSRSNNKE